MKNIQMPVAKKPIQEFTGDQLDTLVKFKESREFKLLKELADKEKYKRYQEDFLFAKSMEEISFLRGFNIGVDFIIDAVSRAKEELKNRGDKGEFDNDDNLK